MEMHQAFDVIIVGAGISGLSAARRLVDHDKSLKVVVLEGQSRLGGRILTITTQGGLRVDMGAGWVHGCTPRHPTFQLAKQYGLEGQLFETKADDSTMYGADGREISDAMDKQIWKLVDAFYDWLEAEQEAGGRGYVKHHHSVQDAYDMWCAQQQGGDPGVMAGVRGALCSEVELEYGADLSSLSALHYDQDEDFSRNGREMMWGRGYEPLVNAMSQGLLIYYDQAVTAVDYSGSSAVVVGTAGGRSYSAAQVIVTVPVGVLQRGTIAFTPPLPQRKADAIAALGMGVLDKVVMVFSHRFWEQETGGCHWVTRVTSPPGHWSEFLDISKELGAPCLVALTAGSFAAAQEQRTDAEVTAGVMAALRSVWGQGAPNPTEVHVSRWAANPWSRGAYPHIRPGCPADAFTAMARSLHKKVFFAGDGTHQKYPATVHGAILSGQREADAVLSARHSATAQGVTAGCDTGASNSSRDHSAASTPRAIITLRPPGAGSKNGQKPTETAGNGHKTRSGGGVSFGGYTGDPLKYVGVWAYDRPVVRTEKEQALIDEAYEAGYYTAHRERRERLKARKERAARRRLMGESDVETSEEEEEQPSGAMRGKLGGAEGRSRRHLRPAAKALQRLAV